MKKLIKYFKECVLEMKKVSWPNRQTVISSTKLVIITTIFFALLLGLADFLLFKFVELLF